MRTLHELPRFHDRWSYLYLERGVLDQEASGLVLHTADAHSPIPIDQLSLVMLGPGISISHAAVKALAANNCLLAWVGENGVRLYAHSTGGTSCAAAAHQAQLVSDEPRAWRSPTACTKASRCRWRVRHRTGAAWKACASARPTRRRGPVRRRLGGAELRPGRLVQGHAHQPRPVRRQRLPLRRLPRGHRVGRLFGGARLRPHGQDAQLRLRRGRPLQDRDDGAGRLPPGRHRDHEPGAGRADGVPPGLPRGQADGADSSRHRGGAQCW